MTSLSYREMYELLSKCKPAALRRSRQRYQAPENAYGGLCDQCHGVSGWLGTHAVSAT